MEQSLRLRETVGDRHGQGYSLNSLLEIFRRDGDFTVARTYGLRALSLFEQIGDQAGQALVRLNLATVEVDEQKWETAEQYLTESLGYTDAQGLREISYQIHAEWSRLYEAKGDTARALHHFKQFHTIKDALLNETTLTRLRNLEVVHRVAQAQSEADLLRRHNALLAAANARQAELLTQLQHQATALETLSRTDALTGLLNRRSLEEAFIAAHENARKHRQPLSVALLDLDHFKRINDRFSHQTGDAVLRTVARLLTENCRPNRPCGPVRRRGVCAGDARNDARRGVPVLRPDTADYCRVPVARPAPRPPRHHQPRPVRGRYDGEPGADAVVGRRPAV